MDRRSAGLLIDCTQGTQTTRATQRLFAAGNIRRIDRGRLLALRAGTGSAASITFARLAARTDARRSPAIGHESVSSAAVDAARRRIWGRGGTSLSAD